MVLGKEILSRFYTLIYTHHCELIRSLVSHWQLVTAFHDEGSGLILCMWHTQDHDQTHCYHVSFGFVRTNTTIVMSSTVIVGVSLIMRLPLPLQSLLHNWARFLFMCKKSHHF
jgi:hypothetical protein